MLKIKVAYACGLLIATTCQAAPIQFDTTQAHVIVTRPADVWSADSSSADAFLEVISDKKANYRMRDANNEFYRGTPNVLQGVSDGAVVQEVWKNLQAAGWSSTSVSKYGINLEKPIEVKPADFSKFAEAQNFYYQAAIKASGNPADAENGVVARKVFGGLLAGGLTVLTLGKVGFTTTNIMLSSNVPQDVYSLTYQKGFAPQPLENIPNLSKYNSIEVHRATTGYQDRQGQIIIAYKQPKTEAAETEALSKAIYSLLGADTSPEAVQTARQDDYNRRLMIWNQCVAEGGCKSSDSAAQ